MSDELKPCPFCNGEGVIYEYSTVETCYCQIKNEPAPAQDEREAFEREFVKQHFSRRGCEVGIWEVNAALEKDGDGRYLSAPIRDAWAAHLATRPSQTEQQPIRLPERKRTDHLPKEYKTMTVVRAGLEAYNRALDDVAALNAAPIAQTEQQPARLPERISRGSSEPNQIFADGWNECLDEVVRLNAAPIAQTSPSVCMGCVDLSSHVRELQHKMDYYKAQTSPQPEQSGLVEAVTPEIIDWVRCGLSVNGRLVDGTHPALEKLCAAYRAALSSTPSPAKRGDA